MALPNPDRTIPNTDTVGPPGPSGGEFANKVAAEVQRIWDLVPNMLVNIGGSADAITAKCEPPLVSSYIHGQRFWLIPAANNTGPVTIDIDERGQVDVVSYDGQQLQAGDLVAGEGTELVYDGDNNQMRLVHPTARELLARASGGATLWEQIGDSGDISGATAMVEFTFQAGRYANIRVLFLDVESATSGGATAKQLDISLRHSSGAIATLSFDPDSGSASLARVYTGWVDIAIGGAASALHAMYGAAARLISSVAGVMPSSPIGNRSSTPPDRVRVAFAGVNIEGGRVVAYGLIKETS